MLEREGISVEVVDPRTLRPLDDELIFQSVRKTNRCVIVQEATPHSSSAADRLPRTARVLRRSGRADRARGLGRRAGALRPEPESVVLPDAARRRGGQAHAVPAVNTAALPPTPPPGS